MPLFFAFWLKWKWYSLPTKSLTGNSNFMTKLSLNFWGQWQTQSWRFRKKIFLLFIFISSFVQWLHHLQAILNFFIKLSRLRCLRVFVFFVWTSILPNKTIVLIIRRFRYLRHVVCPTTRILVVYSIQFSKLNEYGN